MNSNFMENVKQYLIDNFSTEQTLQVDFKELEAEEPPFEKERENRTCWLGYHQWHQPEHIKRHLQDEAKRINLRSGEKQDATPPASNNGPTQFMSIRKISGRPNIDRSLTKEFEKEMRKPIVELNIWARQVEYIPHLDCIVSCTSTTESSLVLAWRKPGLMKL